MSYAPTRLERSAAWEASWLAAPFSTNSRTSNSIIFFQSLICGLLAIAVADLAIGSRTHSHTLFSDWSLDSMGQQIFQIQGGACLGIGLIATLGARYSLHKARRAARAALGYWVRGEL